MLKKKKNLIVTVLINLTTSEIGIYLCSGCVKNFENVFFIQNVLLIFEVVFKNTSALLQRQAYTKTVCIC